MPSIKETLEIIKYTPHDQATMLVGGHGKGKSECINSALKERGYRAITLFVGQMADAGDFTGLPDRVEMKVKWEDEEGKEHEEIVRITEFCSPKWWPFNPNEKVAIFLDEVNRGKPEIMQCLMDMVLNRKLNGNALPKKTRIIAAINPGNDGFYQVEQLDPAFLDRFNVYNFEPTVEEWIMYAAKSEFHKPLIEFIAKNDNHLDPPKTEGDDAEARSDQVYPSRRSWERVSDFMNQKKNVPNHVLKNYMFGVVGVGATVAFTGFLETVDKGLTPGVVMTGWNDQIAKTIKNYNIAQVIFLNSSIARWFDDNAADLQGADVAKTYVANLSKYFDVIKPDAMAHFWGEMSNAQKENKKWPEALIEADPTETLVAKYLEVRNGIIEEENEDWD